jgi:Sulfatase-modifying factor enzyme 1
MTDEAGGPNRVIRGGSWNNDAQNLRSANRNNNTADNRNNDLGFRLVSTFRFARQAKSTDFVSERRLMSRSLPRARSLRGLGRTTSEPQL